MWDCESCNGRNDDSSFDSLIENKIKDYIAKMWGKDSLVGEEILEETLLERVDNLTGLIENAKDDKLVQQVLGVEGWKKELVKAVEEIKTKNDIIEKLLEDNKKINNRITQLEMNQKSNEPRSHKLVSRCEKHNWWNKKTCFKCSSFQKKSAKQDNLSAKTGQLERKNNFLNFF